MDTVQNDQQLLAQIAADDRTAFAAIYNTYWEELFDSAYKRLKNPAQCEDIVQDLFIGLWNRRRDLQIRDLKGYLHTSIKYRVYNYIRRDLVQEAFYEPFESIAECTPDTGPSPLEEELFLFLEAYFNSLPNRQKQVFVLYFKEQHSVHEIAKKLDISPKTVQNHISTSLLGLRSHIIPAIILLCLYVNS